MRSQVIQSKYVSSTARDVNLRGYPVTAQHCSQPGSSSHSRLVTWCRWLLWRRSRTKAALVTMALLTAVALMTSFYPKSTDRSDSRSSTARLGSQSVKKNAPASRIVQHVDYVIPDRCSPDSSPEDSHSFPTLPTNDISDVPLSEAGLKAQEIFVWHEEELPGRRPEVILEPTDVCRSKSPRLLVLVPSSPTHGGLRHLIRTTWASVRRTGSGDIGTVFPIGRSPYPSINEAVQQESRRHGDILQMDLFDSYRNLTLKVLGALSWVTQHCTAEFVLKADDDTFINLSALLRMLTDQPAPTYALWGHFYMTESGVPRTGRWAVDPDLYPHNAYPRYASGVAYVVTGMLAACLVDQWRHTADFPVEDVYVTGVLLPRCQASRRFQADSLVAWSEQPPDPCLLAGGTMMAAHHMTPRQVEELWRLQQYVQKAQRRQRASSPASLDSILQGGPSKAEGKGSNVLEERDAYEGGVLKSWKDAAAAADDDAK